MVTVLRQRAMQLVQQIPEDQVPNIIQYLHSLIGKVGFDRPRENEARVSPKMKAFMEFESMVKPVLELDYRKELGEARDEKYVYPDCHKCCSGLSDG